MHLYLCFHKEAGDGFHYRNLAAKTNKKTKLRMLFELREGDGGGGGQ